MKNKKKYFLSFIDKTMLGPCIRLKASLVDFPLEVILWIKVILWPKSDSLGLNSMEEVNKKLFFSAPSS
jgi:hypothetical protein